MGPEAVSLAERPNIQCLFLGASEGPLYVGGSTYTSTLNASLVHVATYKSLQSIYTHRRDGLCSGGQLHPRRPTNTSSYRDVIMSLYQSYICCTFESQQDRK